MLNHRCVTHHPLGMPLELDHFDNSTSLASDSYPFGIRPFASGALAHILHRTLLLQSGSTRLVRLHAVGLWGC